MRKNSLLHWYPFIKDLDIPQPETLIFKLTDREIVDLTSWAYGRNIQPLSKDRWRELKSLIKPLGYPVFMRTDETSCKHSWETTCFVPSEKLLEQHVSKLMEDNALCGVMGLPYQALIFREYIKMNTLFHAFHGKMPVNPEYRFFVSEGKVECFHWYWIKDAIEKGSRDLPKNWNELLTKSQNEIINSDGLKQLQGFAEKVSSVVPGRWSVDFCQAKDGTWYLIDMAQWCDSWHPTYCKNCPEDQKRESKIDLEVDLAKEFKEI